MSIKTLIPSVIATVFVFAASTQAAVIGVTNSTAVAGPRVTSGDLFTTVSNWSLNGGNAVVVLFAAENGIDFQAEYGTEPLDILEIHDGDRHVASIGYLINPIATVADLRFAARRPASRISHAYAIFSLENVGSLADDDERTSNGNLSYMTNLDGGYVLAVAENNNHSGPAPTVSGGNIDMTIFSQAVDGNNSITIAHGDVATAGSYSVGVSGGVSAANLVAFDPIPEPASMALLGVGGVLIALRRRK